MLQSRVTDKTEFLRLARERFTYAQTADRDDRIDAVDDMQFAAGNQWKQEAIDSRDGAGRPVLTWNRTQGFIAQVVNDGRQNKPSIKVSAMDGGSKETAELLQSRIRQIEYDSEADIAYDTAREHQVTAGRGFYRVNTRYVPGSMNQEICIERIENPFSVLIDPAARQYDRSDAEWCFVISVISRDEYQRRFGSKTEAARSAFFVDAENPAPDWIGVGENAEQVQIAEYWVKEHRKRTLVELASGEAMWYDELPEDTPPEALALDEDGNPITREDDDVRVCQYIIDGVDILDETEWLGSLIPIVPQWGKELTVAGKRRTFSLIRFAKDAQRLINLYVSNIAEQIAQMPKTPWVVAEGQIPPQYAAEWANANNTAKAYLPYSPVAIGGTLAPPPHRSVNEPPIQALTVGLQQAIDAMKAACNIYDPSLGAKSNETSGIAIQRRQKESDVANFHFHDNEARSRRLCGRILLELIPKLTAKPQTIATRSEDGKTTMVRVNEPWRNPETNELVHHDLSAGQYGVAIATGPSYTSQRQEAYDIYSQIATADKNFMVVAGDLLFRNLDAPGADQIADRYEKALPPPLQPKKNEQQPIPPGVQQQLQGYGALVDQLTSRVNQLQNEIDTKRVELDSRERIAAMQESTKKEIAIAQLASNEGLRLLEQDLASVKHQLQLVQEAGLEAARQRHQQSLQLGQQAHQFAMQAQAQTQQDRYAQAQAQQAPSDQADEDQQQLPQAA